MRLQVYWNPLHPAVGMKDAIRTLVLYYTLLTLTLAVAGVDVTSFTFTLAVCAGATGVGIVKAWQRRFSPVAPLGNPFQADDARE